MSPSFQQFDSSSNRRSSAAERRAGSAGFRDDDDLPPTPPKAKPAFAFRAELDLAELDGRGRPGPTWGGRAVEISRSHLVVRSRRMCYEGREVLIAVHLIDDKPTALFGVVSKSDYDGDGLYRTVFNLQRLPENDAVAAWCNTLQPRHRE